MWVGEGVTINECDTKEEGQVKRAASAAGSQAVDVSMRERELRVECGKWKIQSFLLERTGG